MKRNYKGSNNPHYKGIFSKKCLVCINLIKGPPFWVRDRKFCSHKCWYKYNIGEKHWWTNNLQHKKITKQIGYRNKGRKHTEESKRKRSMPGNLNPMFGRTHTEKVRKILREKRLKQKFQFPSKSQIKLYNILKQKYPTMILEYPFSPYLIDMIIPELKIAIEFDGKYWHSSLLQYMKDKVKGHYLEDNGWTVIRFNEETLKIVEGLRL